MPTILFLTGSQDARAVGELLGREGKARWLSTDDLEVVRREGERDTTYRFLFHVTASGILAALSRTAADLVVVDNRPPPDRPYRAFGASPAGRLLPILSGTRTGTRMVSRRQIVLLLSTGESLARDVYVAGAMKLGGYVVDPFVEPAPGAPSGPTFLDQLAMMLGTRRPGKLGLCLSGGGIEGLIYELGVLRAIDEFLVGRQLADFDVFCGISAGAVIASFLANGVSVQHLITGLRDGTPDIEPMRRGTLFTPNHAEILSRVAGLLRTVLPLPGPSRRRPAILGESELPAEPGSATTRKLDALGLLTRVVPGGFFSGDRLRWYLEEQLTRGGRTNCFRQLRKELYVGATDQDSGRAIVFGEAGYRDVPISHAVRASTALVPYYPPETIGGRFLVDGAFTRTTNFTVAIRHGARLVLIVNPFVPLLSQRAGAVHGEGGVFAGLQAIKSLVHSRFEQAFVHIDEVYPDVDFHVFIPEGEELEQLTGTLMRFFYRVEIGEIAYEHTCARLRRQLPALTEQFRRHGLLLRDPQSDAPVALSGPAPDAEPGAPEVAASAS